MREECNEQACMLYLATSVDSILFSVWTDIPFRYEIITNISHSCSNIAQCQVVHQKMMMMIIMNVWNQRARLTFYP